MCGRQLTIIQLNEFKNSSVILPHLNTFWENRNNQQSMNNFTLK